MLGIRQKSSFTGVEDQGISSHKSGGGSRKSSINNSHTVPEQ